MRYALILGIIAWLDMRTSKNRRYPISLIRILIAGTGHAAGKGEFVVLIKGKNQQAVVLLRPLIIAIQVLPQPLVSPDDGALDFAIMHIIGKIRSNEGDSRQLVEIRRKVLGKSQV